MAKDVLKGALVGGVVASVVMVSTQALAGTGIGGVLDLGRTNTVNATTTLSGATHGHSLQLTNQGSGPALGLTVRPGKAPLTVNAAAGKARNLNADKLDGISAHGFLQASDLSLSQQHGWMATVDGGTVVDFLNDVRLLGSGDFLLPLTTPNTIGWHTFHLADVEVCYTVSSTGGKIDTTQVFRSTVLTTIDDQAFDLTDHTSPYPAVDCYVFHVNDNVAPANSVYTLELGVVGTVDIVRVTSTYARTY